jgi:hypothetical protein
LGTVQVVSAQAQNPASSDVTTQRRKPTMSNADAVAGLNDAVDRLDSKGVQGVILKNRKVLTPEDLNAALQRVVRNETGDARKRTTVIRRLRDAGATD